MKSMADDGWYWTGQCDGSPFDPMFGGTWRLPRDGATVVIRELGDGQADEPDAVKVIGAKLIVSLGLATHVTVGGFRTVDTAKRYWKRNGRRLTNLLLQI